MIGQGIRTFGQELKAWHHLFVNRRADRTPCAAPKRSPILLWRTFLKFSPTTTKNVLFDGVATLREGRGSCEGRKNWKVVSEDEKRQT